ncbi:E3 ubiquitin-protein ligase MYLIP [Vanessa tameamea]|uniref:E3 ubiquitin-protein ligase MYLIP n=1 Tax=Vanessa tameamea TaxID=334116 RepID=A0A8B8IDV1_VANTA|nr:E3 ubiquitin-protein ligase MYLIP [Vanessa tameamea]XP_047540215.1 E3 ubiquitin-protein ligase MYLIP [Vanessa atalanta]
MWLVSQPNSVILEVKVEPNSIGQQCLEKVCEKLEIGAEADYFGLRVCSGSGPGRWLNLRNHLDPHRIPSRRLDLRVKFWVPPHLLINEPTRHQFYLHAKLDLIEGRLVVADQEVARRIIAYIAQAETGDCDPDVPTHVYAECHKIGPQGEKPDDHMAKIIEYHCEISGMRASQAEYRLLKEISKLESFGEELFFCKPTTQSNNAYNLYSHLLYHRQQAEEPRARDEQEIDGGATVGCLATGQNGGGCGCRLSTCVGVGPHGIVVYRPACNGEHEIGVEKQSIPYTAIHRAQPLRRIFQLAFVTGKGHEATMQFKMATSGQAAALYRAVTEKHAFYCCETVRTDVTEQFIRDLKGTIASIFNDSSTLGRRYVFDIRRTCREVHDRARRDRHARAPAEPRRRAGPAAEESRQRSRSRSGSDVFACRVCMDAAIDTLFLPCRHVVCCNECAPRCERCPLCRGEIEKLMHIFLPVEYQKSPGVIIK